MRRTISIISLGVILIVGCGSKAETFEHFSEQFADLYIFRYDVPGFDELPLQQKQLLYYLYEAALSGRDIFYDQNYAHNLRIRKTLEAIVRGYSGDRTTEAFEQFMVYTKRVWFSNGIHHHYSMDKIVPDFDAAYFAELLAHTPANSLFLDENQSTADLANFLTPIMFDPAIAPKKVNLAADIDQVEGSAVNFYGGVTQKEVEQYYASMVDPDNSTPVSFGLNSKLIKENGELREVTWKVGGMYGPAIERVVYWLEKAATVAENEKQRDALEKLVVYYRSGDLADFDAYNIAWVADVDSDIDVINGFIEVYDDPLGYRASYESVVQVKDPVTSRRIDAIGAEAQWFEDNSPIMDSHKKTNVKGIIANVINVVVEAGATSPSTPIGINLPNSSWIRKEHGSKSVSLGNIIDAYNGARAGNGFLEEFGYSQEEIDRRKKYGTVASNLHVDMHEVIGHASGQLEDGVGATRETLKSYASALEEGRADLVALYYTMDPKLVEMGIMPSLDVGKAEYDSYIRGGMMTQLTRIKLGNDIEESHMRNRAMIAHWAFEKGAADNVIEMVKREDNTYFVIRDYDALRDLFAELLRETQRIKSQGDYEAGKALIEDYGVKIDPFLHKEVLRRFAKLNIAPYGGAINPKLTAVMKGDEIVDVTIAFPTSFTDQMLEYADAYSFLPIVN